MTQSSPFTGAVVSAMRRLYPETLADKSFDNTGLLLEAPYQPGSPRKANSVLLTIDLTTAVADEAIAAGHSVVVAYHPIIFRGLKSITLNDTQQMSLLRLAANGTSVYSPHTAVDIVPGGMGDWLCDIVTKSNTVPNDEESTSGKQVVTKSNISSNITSTNQPDATGKTYSEPTYIEHPSTLVHSKSIQIPHKRSVITSSPASAIDSANKAHQPSSLHATADPYTIANTGAGRLITFTEPQPLRELIHRISIALGTPKALQIAIPQTKTLDDITVKTIGLCPGSGSSVLSAARPAPDLVFTGELSHHEALAVIERGGVVITLNHSNSERGYLTAVMQAKLKQEVQDEWDLVRKQSSSTGDDQNLKEMLADGSVDVVVSKVDRDPFGAMILQ